MHKYFCFAFAVININTGIHASYVQEKITTKKTTTTTTTETEEIRTEMTRLWDITKQDGLDTMFLPFNAGTLPTSLVAASLVAQAQQQSSLQYIGAQGNTVHLQQAPTIAKLPSHTPAYSLSSDRQSQIKTLEQELGL